jgi:Flagellar motor component
MDIVALISLIFGIIALILGFTMEGGVLGALLQPTAAIIVFGGLTGAVGLSYPLYQLAKIPKIIGVIFKGKKQDREKLMNYLIELATTARRDGLLSLEREISNSEFNDEILKTGLQLVIDASDTESLRHTLETKISNMEERHEKCIAIFESAGGYAPTMGVIGTVMGMVQILSNLTNAAELAEKIAVAFIATLYGVASANLIFLPIASRLKQLNNDEVITKYMILDGIILLQNGSNPALIKEHLKGYLENAQKEDVPRE